MLLRVRRRVEPVRLFEREIVFFARLFWHRKKPAENTIRALPSRVTTLPPRQRVYCCHVYESLYSRSIPRTGLTVARMFPGTRGVAVGVGRHIANRVRACAFVTHRRRRGWGGVCPYRAECAAATAPAYFHRRRRRRRR